MQEDKNLLALNIIAGPGTAPELRTLFDSIKPGWFDEIVIVATTNDPDVVSVAAQLATTAAVYTWSSPRFPHGNFAGARNEALRLTTAEYVMWLDTDDTLKASETNFSRLREILASENFDFLTLCYDLIRDKKGNTTAMLMRERVFRTGIGIEWRYSVHEQLTIEPGKHKRAEINGMKVLHCPKKPSIASVGRNLQILAHEYFNGYADEVMQFYFARELANSGKRRAAVPIILNLVRSSNFGTLVMLEAIQWLMSYYAFLPADGLAVDEPRLTDQYADYVEEFARAGLSLAPEHAEFSVMLGDLYAMRGDVDTAVKFYTSAFNKKYGTGGSQQSEYYEAIPAQRLSRLYEQKNELEQALYYNKIYIKNVEGDRDAIVQRRDLISRLVRTIPV